MTRHMCVAAHRTEYWAPRCPISTATTLRAIDAGVTAILAPKAALNLGDTVIPQAVIKSYGTIPEVVPVTFQIGTSWRDSMVDTLEPGDCDTISFRRWIAAAAGRHVDQCSTALACDECPANDCVRDTFWVIWTEGADERGRSAPTPSSLVLSSSIPNPFRDGTRMVYGFPKAEPFRLEVCNSIGEIVGILASGIGRPGYWSTAWRGVDGQGRRVPPGIYFVRLESEGTSLIRKLVKLE